MTDGTQRASRTDRRVPATGILWIAGAVVALLLACLVDRPAAQWLFDHRGNPTAKFLAGCLWPLGSGTLQASVIALLTLVGLALRRHRIARIGTLLFLTLVIAAVLTSGLKRVVRRPRPQHMDQPRPTMSVQMHSGEWHSFPSGDVLASCALALVLWHMLDRAPRHAWLLAWPVLVSVQRLAAARHFPSDVVSGLVLGFCVYVAIVSAARRVAHAGARRDRANPG